MAETYYIASIVGWGLCALLIYVAGAMLHAAVPPEDREYMDPLSAKLKIIWPLIRILAYYVCTNLPNELLDRTDKQLHRTGVSYLMTAEQFMALRLFLAMLFPLVAWLLLNAWGNSMPLLIVVAPVIGFLMPELWLRDTRKRRTLEIVMAMPVYLDFITMAVEAGLNLSGALQQGVDKGHKGALRSEFSTVLRDIRSGLTRAEALRRMADRLDITEITSFVSSVIQAEKLGSSMGLILRAQSEQRRDERFQRAEKMAMEAPVKLIFPLVVFIFPVTFLVLGFPIVMKFLNEGIL